MNGLLQLWRRARESAQAVGAFASHKRRKSERRRRRPVRPVFETLEVRLVPTILIVNSLDDLPLSLGDTNVTLRDAIFAANNDLPIFPNGPAGSGADEIQFQSGLTGKITLSQGQLTISSDLTITGPGASLLAISGNNASGVFFVTDGNGVANLNVTLSSLTITAGQGGVFNAENLSVLFCTLSDNTAGGFGVADGGGILNRGNLTVRNCTLSGNRPAVHGHGGGIDNQLGGTLTVQNSTLSGNKADTQGGGIYNSSTLTVQNSTITQNHADNDNDGFGGGGGIYVVGGTATLHNTIVAGNFKGSGGGTRDDVNGAVDVSSRNNLIGVNTGLTGISNGTGGNQVGTAGSHIDPQLGFLFASNGGLTATHALLAGSPAINTGSNVQAVGSTDQRGSPFVRIDGGAVDIGAYEVQTLAIPLIVDSTPDVNDADYSAGNLSLREAIYLANGGAGANTITFSATVFATPQTIILSGTELNITDDLTLTGPGAGLLTVSGNNRSRVFYVADGDFSFDRTVMLSGLTVTGGNAGDGGGINNAEDLTVENITLSVNMAGSGGGIYNDQGATLTVRNSTLRGNTSNDGAGIYSRGTLTVQNSTLSGNNANNNGGGIVNFSGPISVQNSTLSGNTANTNGGGIYSIIQAIVQNSTLSGNMADGQGGGIFSLSGSLTVENSTLSGNLANSSAGGIRSGGTLNVRNSTITQNHADNDGDGGGIGGGIRTVGTVTLHNTIVAGNFQGNGSSTTRDDVNGAVENTSTNNLIAANTGLTGISNGTGGNLIGTAASPLDPKLGPLSDSNGGTTATHALLAGSPAIDRGNNGQVPVDVTTGQPVTTDQRGNPFVRIFNPNVDIGAYEVQTVPLNLVVDTTDDVNNGDYRAGNLSLREAISLANGSVGADTITFSPAVFATPQTITLGGTELMITDDLILTGPGATLLAVSSDNPSRVFNVDDGTATVRTVTLSGLTITGRGGGGILNAENLTMQLIGVFDSFAAGSGGGILNSGTLTVQNSVVDANRASTGGGIANSGTLILQNSGVSSNTGGGISNTGMLTVQNSMLAYNSATFGGAIVNLGGTLIVQNSTLSGNKATSGGGGLYNTVTGTLTARNSTITQNHADNDDMGGELGGGIAAFGRVTLHNTIVAGNFKGSGTATPNDVNGALDASSTSNLIGVNTGLSGISNNSNGNQVGTAGSPINPQLGPLANNGGRTPTHALLSGSPAIDLGDNAQALDATDQRGGPFVRIFNSTVDIGAFEVQAQNQPPTINSNGGGDSATVNVPENTTAVADVDATDPDSGDTLSFSISGSDAGKFAIDNATGVLTFIAAPDFESPTDTNGDNVYEVTVQVSDGSLTDTQALSVTVTDVNDSAGITVTPTAGLVTTESGGTATFTVVLNSVPTADVTIILSSSDTAEGSVSPASLTFTPANARTPRTVTITGVNDAAADGDIAYMIITTAATSADGNYSGIDPTDVSVTNTDNDVPGITVSPTAGLITTEAGGTATFTVVLNTIPTADVTIALSSSNTTEGTVSIASLTFTPADALTPQTVTVTGVNDAVADGDIAYAIVTGVASSGDANYNGIDPADVSVTNIDNDSPGVTVTPTAGLITTESGVTAAFTVVLNTVPTAIVTIALSSSDTTEGTVSPASLTFTPGNALTPQTVTVTGVNDAVADGDIAYTIFTGVATSADVNYNGIDPADVSVTNRDNYTAGITVTPTAGLVTTESGGTATFTDVLNTVPTADVTIGLSSSDTTEGTVLPVSLTFTPVNALTPQKVTITGVNDAAADGDIAYMISTAAATSADGNYSGIDPTDVSVTNTDNDVPGITVSPTAGLITTEAGGTATFTVVLATIPTDDVTIALSTSDTAEGTVSDALLTFTPANALTPQTVTVTGVDDSLVDGNIVYTIITDAAASSDANYDGTNAEDVSVTNNDNDPADLAPTVTQLRLQKDASGKKVTDLLLHFSEDVSGATAPANYVLTAIGRRPKPLVISSATYDMAAHTARLHLMKPLSLKKLATTQLRVRGDGPLADLTNHLLDGDSNGTPGGDFVRTLNQGLIAAVVVDSLLDADELHRTM